MVEYPQLTVRTRAEWREWLEDNHGRRPGIWLVRFKKGSRWSRINKERVAQLRARGAMTPAGEAAIERAQADGTWAALDAVEALHEPDDLREALDADPSARRNWDAFPRSTRRAILEWILAAKRPGTRAARIAETADKARVNIRANQWRQPARSSPPDAP